MGLLTKQHDFFLFFLGLWVKGKENFIKIVKCSDALPLVHFPVSFYVLVDHLKNATVSAVLKLMGEV